MTRQVDTYSVAQSALALGVSPKRVRQLIDQGLLTKHSIEPITIKQSEVIDLKVKREQAGTRRGTQKSLEVSKVSQGSDKLLERISELINQSSETNRRAIELVQESAQRNEMNLIAQVNELKAENERLRARKWWKK